MRLSVGSLVDPMGSLYSTLAFLLLTSSAYAQQDLPDLSTAERPGEATTTTTAPSATATEGDDQETTTAESTAESTAEATETTEAAETTETTESPTTTADSEATTAFRALPSVTSAPSIPPSSVYHLTNVPTIGGVGVPTLVVPYTANAPYMQKSNLPEGTVFICVGAALGFLGASILAWRGLVAWSLHRSVKRAAMGQNYPGDLKSGVFRTPGTTGGGAGGGFYSAAPQGSAMSLERLHSTASGVGKLYRGSATTPRGSLFFSPTADTGMHTPTDRSSGYLPAGFYSHTAAAPAAGAGITHLGPGGPVGSVFSSPASQGYARTRSYLDPTPPGSPGLASHRSTMTYDRGGRGTPDTYARSSMVGTVNGGYTPAAHQLGSTSTLNLTVPGSASVPGQRAPSAYLEDLFESHGNGGQRF